MSDDTRQVHSLEGLMELAPGSVILIGHLAYIKRQVSWIGAHGESVKALTLSAFLPGKVLYDNTRGVRA